MNVCRRCASWHQDNFPWCFDCAVFYFGIIAIVGAIVALIMGFR